jgi:type VI secretion system secreted protein Hcp
MKKIFLLAALSCITFFGFSQNIFLSAGPVPTDTPEGQPILAYSFGVSNSGSSHVGGGMGSGKANFQDISLTLYNGNMSHELLRSAALGTHFPEMKLKFYENSKKMFYEIILKDVMVTSFSQSTSCGKGPCSGLAESITLTYSQVQFKDHKNDKSISLSPLSGN